MHESRRRIPKEAVIDNLRKDEKKNMESVKISESGNAGLSPIINDFLRVGMWPISETVDPETKIVKQIYRYGKGEKAGAVVVHGKLCEHDRGAFLLIRALDKDKKYKGIRGKITDLVKMKGVKNPYDRASITAMRDSLEALLDVHIRIKPNRAEASLSAAFKLVTGWIYTDGSFFLTTHDLQMIVDSLGLYEINIPIKEYFSSKSPITRSLREFLRTQNIPIGGRGYEISLTKLCKYIGYAPSGYTLAQRWQVMKSSMDELKKVGFISKKSTRDPKRLKNEGGVVSFWKNPKKELTKTKLETQTETINFDDVIQLFPDKFQRNALFRTRLQEWINYKHGMKLEKWKYIVREWVEYSPKEVCFYINRAMGYDWNNVYMPAKKEYKCPHNWVFGQDYSSKVGCQDQCNISEKCLAKMRENRT